MVGVRRRERGVRQAALEQELALLLLSRCRVTPNFGSRVKTHGTGFSQSVSQSVITTLLPREHMVPTHSDLLYERAMESQHLVVSSGRARTSG